MDKNRDQRKITNFVINSRAQLRFVKPFAVLIGISYLVIVIIFIEVLAVGKLFDLPKVALAEALNEMFNSVLWTASAGTVLIGLFSFVMWIYYSHRIFGPAVPIRRQIQNLRHGNYGVEITLRKHDEFKEIAEDLNALARELKEKYGAGGPFT